jgi:hypothetical protein
MHIAVCPTCQRKVSLPENTSSRAVKMMCPKCGELLPVPPSASRHPEEDRLAAFHHGRQSSSAWGDARTQIGEALRTTRGQGLLAVLLGVLAFACLAAALFCLPPIMGYAGLLPGGVGFLLGLYGVVRGFHRGERDVLYGLGGVAACGLALGLILTLSTLSRTEKTLPSNDQTPTMWEQRKDLR